MQRKYAYVFSVGSKVVWSGETEESLLKRVEKRSQDVEEAQELIRANKVGNFCSFSTGEMVFQIA